MLIFESGFGIAGDDLFLRQEEDDKDRNYAKGRSRHQQSCLRRGFLIEIAEPDLQDAELRSCRHDQRPHKAIPGTDDREDCRSRDHGLGERDNNAPEHAEGTASVYGSGFEELFGKALEMLTEEEDRKDIDAPGDYQCLICIQPGELVQEDVGRDQIDRFGHHHHTQEEVKEQVLALELHSGKGIGGQDGSDQHTDQGHEGYVYRIREVGRKRHFLKRLAEVVPMDAGLLVHFSDLLCRDFDVLLGDQVILVQHVDHGLFAFGRHHENPLFGLAVVPDVVFFFGDEDGIMLVKFGLGHQRGAEHPQERHYHE